tara:strand:- start:2220 stop:2633 length:414 start_codon:yes stop_codon:yes gene_type:complete
MDSKINVAKIELPSNRKFGFFFALVFAILGAYFYQKNYLELSICMFVLSFLLIAISVLQPNLLLPLNKLWMKLGYLMGTIVSPIILGVLFFGLFTPIAFLMRIFGRDELRLKPLNRLSHWKKREGSELTNERFKQQF